jgi:DNA-directed RNA polymerase subunit RPC12/RpoP
MKVSVKDLLNCPECGTKWITSVIPAERRENYAWPYFYSRINACYSIETDRTEYYQCPDCKATFPRFGPDVKTYEVDRKTYPT